MFAKLGVRRNASHGRSIRGSRLLLLAIATVMGIVLVVGVVLAGVVTIDSFDDGFVNLTVWNEYTSDEDFDTGSMIGGERDSQVNWLSGTGASISLQIDLGGSNRLSFSQGPGIKGNALCQWDDDGSTFDSSMTREYDLGEDLTDSGDNDSIVFRIVDNDIPLTVTVKAYTNASNWSYYDYQTPGSIDYPEVVDVVIPHNSFSTGGGGSVTWTSVGAVELAIDGSLNAGADVSLDFQTSDDLREFGDLPITYTTSILDANHIPQGLRLGDEVDTEDDSQPSANADGDDTNGADDEDGVAPTSLPWSAGSNGGAVNVTREGCAAVGTCYVNGWIDWNNDGDFDDLNVDGASEHIVNNVSRTTDTTEEHTFNTPTSYSAGSYYARFRICQGSTDCDYPDTTDTNVTNGEVEDYKWDTTPTAVTLTRLDATSVPSRLPVGAAASVLAFLAGSVVVSGALMRRRRTR